MRHELPRRIIAPLVALLTLGLSSGCARCGGDVEGDDSGSVGEETSWTRASVTDALAGHFAAETPALFILHDPTDVADAYADFRPHVEAVLGGDLGMIETDLRNTLGIDLSRPETLGESGVAPDGGLAIGVVGDHPVVALLLSDRASFEERLTSTLQGRPFNLRGDVERRRVGEANVLIFRRSNGYDPALAVVTLRDKAFFFPNADADDLDAAITEAIARPDESLASLPAYQASVESAAEYQVHGYLSAESVVTHRRDDVVRAISDAAPEGAPVDEIIADLRAMGDVTIGLELAGGEISATVVQAPEEAVVREFDTVTAGDSDPGFAPLAVPDVYAFLRLTIAADRLYELVRNMLGEQRLSQLDAGLAAQAERVGMDPATELLPALGSDAILLFTRARLLTLSRAMNSGSPGEFFSGLGVVIALEVRDADTVKRALETIVPGLDGRANVFEDDGNTVVEFTDAQADIGNLVLTDRFLLLVPGRQRQEVFSQLAGGESDLGWCDVEGARALVTAPSGNGLFIDVRRVVDGPIGQVAFARLPNEVRRMLGRIDRVHTTTFGQDGKIVTELGIRFAEPDTQDL